MSQYYNFTTGHIARDCDRCDRLVEVWNARKGMQVSCGFCGKGYEVVPVTMEIYRNDRVEPVAVRERAYRLEPVENELSRERK